MPASALAPFSAAATQKQAEAIRKNSVACVKTALADLEAMQRGPNNIPNADAIRKDLQKQLQALEKPAAPPKPVVPSEGTATGLSK